MISISDSIEAIVFSQKFWRNNKIEFIEEVLRPNSFLGSMRPIYWLILTSNYIAYDAGPGFAGRFISALSKVQKKIAISRKELRLIRKDYNKITI